LSALILIRAGATRRNSFEEVADWLLERAPTARVLAAAQLLAVGLATMIAVGL
jgi:hypothetical protein